MHYFSNSMHACNSKETKTPRMEHKPAVQVNKCFVELNALIFITFFDKLSFNAIVLKAAHVCSHDVHMLCVISREAQVRLSALQ